MDWQGAAAVRLLAIGLGAVVVSCSSAPVPSPSTSESVRSAAPRSSTPGPTTSPAAIDPAPTPTSGDSPSPTASPVAGAPNPADIGWFQSENNDGDAFAFHVGRLDARAFSTVTPTYPQGSGPANGRVLGWWREGGHTIVTLFRTADGSRRELLRADGDLAPALDPVARFWYWVPWANGRADGLWRQALAGGAPERVSDGWMSRFPTLKWSVDGRRLAIESARPGTDEDYDYRVFDTRSGRMTEILGRHSRVVVGFLGPELIVYGPDRGDAEYHFPLLAIDVRHGSSRTIVDGDGIFAGIFQGSDEPQLVYDGPSDDGRYALHAIGAGDGQSRLLFAGSQEWLHALDGPEPVMTRSDTTRGLEVPGWVPVLPGAFAFLTRKSAASFAGQPRYLVRLADGAISQLPPMTQVP